MSLNLHFQGDIKITYFTGMFLNFVFSAACKHKRGGGNKSLSKSHTKASKRQLMGALHQRRPRAGAGAVGPVREIVLGLKFVYQWGLF